jgi:hypothetical protein
LEDARNTAWRLPRLGVAAVLAALALSLGGVAARGDAPVPDPEIRQTAGRQYGPNPAYRLTPQINRIIRVAQRSKLDEEKKDSGERAGTLRLHAQPSGSRGEARRQGARAVSLRSA